MDVCPENKYENGDNHLICSRHSNSFLSRVGFACFFFHSSSLSSQNVPFVYMINVITLFNINNCSNDVQHAMNGKSSEIRFSGSKHFEICQRTTSNNHINMSTLQKKDISLRYVANRHYTKYNLFHASLWVQYHISPFIYWYAHMSSS